jgi:hypothetical protein
MTVVYEPLSVVMSTTVTPANANNSLDFQFGIPANDALGYYVYMHFVELEKLSEHSYWIV